MQSFTEDHSSKNLAALLDRSVRLIPSLDLSKTELTSVNDNASNIVRGITLSETIGMQVNCAAHTLQLVINDCIASNQTINEIIDSCKSLAAKTHRSSKVCNKLRDMCERLDGDPNQDKKWPYRVIISPGGVRWDSMYLCMKSILQLEEPLLQLRSRDADFADVPSEEQFATMTQLSDLLGSFHRCVETLSAEITPTMHLVVEVLYNLNQDLIKAQEGSGSGTCLQVRAWAEQAVVSLDRRFPDCGASKKEFALGNLLHPLYRGLVARKMNRVDYDRWIEELISENQVRNCYCICANIHSTNQTNMYNYEYMQSLGGGGMGKWVYYCRKDILLKSDNYVHTRPCLLIHLL